MKFFIRAENGVAVGHPVDRASLLALYPGGVPEVYEAFVPMAPPEDLGVYEKIDAEPSYVFNGFAWTHDYNRRNMTAAEKAEHIAAIQADWLQNGYASWTFLEEECRYVPPIQPPSGDAVYHWDEAAQEWLDGPGLPSS